MVSPTRAYRAGESLEDFCRACKTDRMHTVIVVDGDGLPIRVSCGFCHSEHNYRGGPRIGVEGGARGDGATNTRSATLSRLRSPDDQASYGEARRSEGAKAAGSRTEPRPRSQSARDPFPIVSERERTGPAMPLHSDTDLELLLRRVIREETGITPVTPADKWRGGTLVLRPGTAGLQEKSWPIETFFHKVVMLRNRLRTLEQQVNAADLPDDVKVRLQGYISGCYGTLTSFNVLFAEEDDQFKGSAES
jgi:hypothetical protein